MKKKLLLITMVILGITTNAQVSIGVKGGLNLNSVSNLDGSSTTVGTVNASAGSKIKLGGHFGVYANINSSDVFGFQPEVLFSMKGYKYESKSTVGNIESRATSDVSLNYIEIPLQLRINPTESFYFLAGPYFGILMGATSVSTSYSSVPPVPPVTVETKSTSTSGLKSLDIGAALGLGFKTENGFTMGLKYSRGFTSINENNTTGTTVTSVKANVNSVFQLFIGFEFGGK